VRRKVCVSNCQRGLCALILAQPLAPLDSEEQPGQGVTYVVLAGVGAEQQLVDMFHRPRDVLLDGARDQ
jgi:hypothetical protein